MSARRLANLYFLLPHSRILRRVQSLFQFFGRSLLICSSAAVSILVITFLHNFAFTAGTFYLALYYQVRQRCSTPSFTSDPKTLGCKSVDAFRVGSKKFTLLPGVLPCLHACCVVHRLLAEQTSGYWRPKFGHIDRSDYLHPGIW